jgi:hypothetical protein
MTQAKTTQLIKQLGITGKKNDSKFLKGVKSI